MLIIYCVCSYLIGAIPTGFLMAKLVKGVDIRTVGSGNPGATNVFRSVGAAAGIITFLFDALKGYLPVFVVAKMSGGGHVYWWILAGLCAIVGHVWTVFLGFKGGKGVATACGVFFALMPAATFFTFTFFLIIVYFTRYISVGSISAAAFLPAFAWVTGQPKVLCGFAAIVGLLVIIKHRNNIARLIKGTENKFGVKTNE